MGISFIDSTSFRVCHNRRFYSHKVIAGLAQRGQCSINWFFGFRLHLVTGDIGHVVDVMLTPGNTDDRKPLQMQDFIDKLFSALIAYNLTEKETQFVNHIRRYQSVDAFLVSLYRTHVK